MLNLQAVVAQGRAVLATFGVKLTRKKKKPTTPTSETVAAPQPSAPVVLPVAA
jgi:hypothetical protein